MLNIGGLYQPLKISIQGFQGNFICYFSTKEATPNQKNGYELKAEN